MTTTPRYLLDSDVFITAKNAYYAFAICPGFWDGIMFHGGKSSPLSSIDRVRDELLAGRKEEDLVQWVRHILPSSFFHATNAHQVTQAYGQIMLWVQRHNRYTDAAKAGFATAADGWLVGSIQHGPWHGGRYQRTIRPRGTDPNPAT